MKKTILKMAGVKDEKSFYKKYPTEAAFLKAHPKAKAQLKKFATGGQMNDQAMQQFAGGGQIGKNIGAGLYGAGEGLLDTLTFGATDQLTDMGYKALQKAGGSTEDEIREQDSIAGYAKAAGAITGGVMNPAALKNSIIETAEGVGQGVSKGSESEEWARTTGQVINAVAPIASMASGSFGGTGGAKTGINANNMQSGFRPMSSTDNIGQTQFGVAKYGGMYNMGGMQQYAMGGFNDPNDPPVSMGVNPNNPQMAMSINKVNTNPYESSPGYKSAEAAKFFSSTGNLYSPGAARGMNPKRLIQEYNSNEINPNKEKGTLKYISGNMNNGTALFQKTDVNGKTSDYYYAKGKDGSTSLYPAVKTQVNNTQVNPQVNPQINPVNNIQNTAQTNIQPENRGEYTNFGQPYTSVKFKGAHGYSGNDVTYKYYDPSTNKEINQDLNKSFDSKGNYIPSFLEQQSNTNNMPVSTNKYGGLMQYAMGGTQYANGGTGEINAEVEGGGYNQNGYNQDGENAIGPNGEFTQFSGPTHAQGGIKTDMAPGTMIFSDKLKMPGSKKSFAALNKLYDTNKEDDVLSSEKSNNTLKLTAMLMRDAKLKQSLALFQEQEQFKQDKVAAYAKRMGVQIPSQDNEQMEPQGMPEQSEGEYKNGGTNNPGFNALPQQVQQNILSNMAMGGIQESDYQTDPGKLSDIQRQLKVVKQQISTLQPDSSFVSGPLAKLRGLEKDLTIRQNNHPEFKKAMGGRLPMYEDGGFDWANAGKQAGNFALQNAGNLYNLYRGTQDNSQLNLSRMTPTLLDKTQDLANNQRMYSEGKRQTAEASQGNASTYLNNMYANRASKLANDLNVNTTYGNLNSQIENSAKLYNAGAIDRETMFKLQAEGMNRNLKGQALSGMSQNLLNQINSNKQDDLDQQRLGIQKDFYKEYWANENRKNQEKINKNKKEEED